MSLMEKNQVHVRPGKFSGGKRTEHCTCCVRNFSADSGYCTMVSVWHNWVEITEWKIYNETKEIVCIEKI